MSFGDVHLYFYPLENNCYFYHSEYDKIEQILKWKRNQLDRMDFFSVVICSKRFCCKAWHIKRFAASKMVVWPMSKNTYTRSILVVAL